MSGTCLVDRYELLEEGPRAQTGRLFRAMDTAFHEVVAVKSLGSSASTRDLEHLFRRVQRCPHPIFVRYYQLYPEEALIVREWIHGFSLLELLKRRRELSAPETLRLLSALPTALDFAGSRGLTLPPQLLDKLLIQFAPEVQIKDVETLPVSQWPAFALRLNPLSVRSSLLDTDGQTTLTTVTDVRSLLTPGQSTSPLRLAELLHEVLGGRNARSRRFTPLPALHEEGNGVLRRALLDAPYPDCRSLWTDLELAEPSDLRPQAPLSTSPKAPPKAAIPEPLLGQAQPGSVLKLIPADMGTPAIHLVARPTFTLGRSLLHADFITRFLPENPANDDLTNQISRVHLMAEATHQKLVIRDGNGNGPSVNGTTLDDIPLPSDHGASLTQRGILCLGGVYSVEVVPLQEGMSDLLQITNLDAWGGSGTKPGEHRGAVLFTPANGQASIRHAVWLFSEIGFGLDRLRRLVWDTRGIRQSQATFHYQHGYFWLCNHQFPEGEIGVAGTALGRDEIAPLAAGMALRIGTLHFTIELV